MMRQRPVTMRAKLTADELRARIRKQIEEARLGLVTAQDL